MVNLAEPLRALGRTAEAIHHLVTASEIAPDKYAIWTNLGSLYAELEINTKALPALQKALELAPEEKRPSIRSLLEEVRSRPAAAKQGAELLISGRGGEALPLLLKKFTASPSDPDVVQNLGIAYLHVGDDSSARSVFEHLHKLEPENQFAWMQLLRLASRRGDLPEAERWCQTYAKLPGMVGRSKAFWAHVLEENGQLQAARQLLLDAMKQHPDEPDLFVAYGDLAIKHNVPRFAVDAYQQAVNLIRSQANQIERLRDIEGRLKRARAMQAGH
jgi:Flp pilus assembly protein TadD